MTRDFGNLSPKMLAETTENPRAIKRYLSAYFSLRPNTLKMLDSATNILQAYEAREAKLKESKEKHRGCPDEDGFITIVSKSTAARMGEEDEMGFEDAANDLLDLSNETTNGKGNKKDKKRMFEEEPRERNGNFYKYQRKGKGRDDVGDLRSRFEEDKIKLAALKSSILFKK